jgi:hypothetical protein
VARGSEAQEVGETAVEARGGGVTEVEGERAAGREREVQRAEVPGEVARGSEAQELGARVLEARVWAVPALEVQGSAARESEVQGSEVPA